MLEVVREAVIETKAIRFEGNNYAAEWVEEAQRRGLPNLRTTPEALAELVRPEARDVPGQGQGVLGGGDATRATT